MVLLLACWSPDPEEGVPSLPPLDGEVAREAGEAEEPPELPAFVAYSARTTVAPVTLVDDWGQPLGLIRAVGTTVEVRGEDDIRKRVWCATCDPPAEGWAQKTAVTDRE